MSKKKKTIPQQKQVCVFCGGSPLTREHFWPTWMRSLSPPDLPNSHLRRDSYLDLTDGTKDEQFSSPRKITGPPTSSQLKIVCSPCNNGWMSRIESQAIPILTSLIKGDAISLGREEQEIISKWIFLKAIIGEYKHPHLKIISPKERKLLKENNVIPEEWMIWIAKLSQPSWNFTHDDKRSDTYYTTTITHRKGVHTAKAITMVVGRLVIYIAKFPLIELGFTSDQLQYSIIDSLKNHLIKIHPTSQEQVHWETIPSIVSQDVDSIINNMAYFSLFFRTNFGKYVKFPLPA